MSESSSLSARSSTDHTTILGRARRLRDGLIIERVQSIERKKTALKGSKDGLEKFKGTSLPELRTITDYPKFDSAVRAALRPKRGGLELLEYEAFREFKELGIAPPFEIANPASVDYDPNGRDLGVCACPLGVQENYISNKSPERELSDGTKKFCAPGGERGFFLQVKFTS